MSLNVPWSDFSRAPIYLCVHATTHALHTCTLFHDRMLSPSLPALHVVAIDLPGHGRSSHRPPGSFYHVQNYIADVKYVTDGECRYILKPWNCYKLEAPCIVISACIISIIGNACLVSDTYMQESMFGWVVSDASVAPSNN